jgi:hypothetical protein
LEVNDVHISHFANDLHCRHCGSSNSVSEWPLQGDGVAFYFQDEPGKFTQTVTCSNCGKDWYIVWDDDPGPITPLGI